MKTAFYLVGCLVILIGGCKKNDDIKPHLEAPIAVEFVIPEDSVQLNPTGYAPLSALVTFSSPVPGKTVIIVRGKHGAETDIKHVFNDEGLTHSIPVAGMYPNFSNVIDLRLINNSGDTVAKSSINIKTDSLPAFIAQSIEADVVPTGQVEEGINLISSFSSYGTAHPFIPLMVDNYGDVRWILNYATHPTLNRLSFDCGIRRLKNGNFYFGDVFTSKIYEVDLLGKVINSWDLKSKGYVFHHDVEEKPDGNFIVSVSKAGSTHSNGAPTIEDYIIEIERQSGSIKTTWDLKESLDEYRTALSTDPTDWMHVNSVLFDSTDNTIIVSGRVQGVAKLTFDNQVRWILSPHKGWGVNGRGEDLKQFLLTPLDASGNKITDSAVLNGEINHTDFEWCWYQHSTIAMPNGDYMLFDNGSTRNYNNAAPKYSRAVEYKIDASNRTIQQKWQYGKERRLETFATIVSKVQYLPNTNHILFSPGFQVKNNNGFGGKIVEVDYNTKQVVSQLSFSVPNKFGFHRVYRLNVYP